MIRKAFEYSQLMLKGSIVKLNQALLQKKQYHVVGIPAILFL